MIRIIVIDNNILSKRGLIEYFRDPSIKIIADANNGLIGLSLIKQSSPHIVVINTALSDMLPSKLCYFISKYSPTTHIVFISPIPHIPTLYHLFCSSNAKAFLTMNTQFSGIEAIHQVYAGKYYIQPDLAHDLIRYATHQHAAIEKKLNNREFEVLSLSAQGKTILEIASRCSISEKTVYNVKSRGIKKLGLKINDVVQLKEILLEKNQVSENYTHFNN